MEGALLVLGMKAGMAPDHLRGEWTRIDEIPFDAAHRFMATLHRGPDGRHVVSIKGAPEALFPRAADGGPTARWEALIAASAARAGGCSASPRWNCPPRGRRIAIRGSARHPYARPDGLHRSPARGGADRHRRMPLGGHRGEDDHVGRPYRHRARHRAAARPGRRSAGRWPGPRSRRWTMPRLPMR